jgi:nitrite reductase/ring-hydroxylating ferredoxin subunit
LLDADADRAGLELRLIQILLKDRARMHPPVDELPPGTHKFLTTDERPIAVFNIKGEFFGLLNRCPHQDAGLCEGPLIGLAQSSDPGKIQYTRLGEIIRCPWNGWELDIRTGQSYCDPKRFRARLSGQCRAGSAVVKGPYIAETLAVSVESDYVGGSVIGPRPEERAPARVSKDVCH